MKKFLYLAFGFLFLINCSSKPSVLDARKVYENIDTNLHSGLIRISKFQKTNAVEGELAGIKFYRIEYEAEVEFLKDVWDYPGNHDEAAKIGIFFNPDDRFLHLIPDSLYRAERQKYFEEVKEYQAQKIKEGLQNEIFRISPEVLKHWESLTPESLHLVSENETLCKKGTTKKVYGVLMFNKTEKGWRGEDGNIY